MSAFKSQNEKRYGNVEKMYIHFYTIAREQDTLDIYWYCNDTENIELFSDVKYFLHKMKGYGQYTTYTGDVFVVKNLHRFKELLILVGAEDFNKTGWFLQNNKCLSVDTCKIKKPSKFYELFDICFEDYEIINSFSSEPSLSKNRIEMDEFITSTVNTTNKPLILVCFDKERFPMPYYNFNQLYFSEIKSKVGDNILNNWFNNVVQRNEYYTVYTTIHKLIDYNEKEVDNTANEEDDDKDDATVMTEQESAKISHDEWIKLFCDLYLDDSSKGSDLLLSDIYQMYLTASGWTQTNTVTMATFIKRLRNMNKFTIKRRAKGMMVIGVSCLVNQQSELFLKVKSGQSYNRQLSHYKSDVEINSILTKYNDEIEKIGLKYTREAFILLNDSNITLDYQTVAQFISIPQISTQLKPYSEYIESVLKNVTETEINGKRVRKFNTEIQKPLEEFRELCTRCVLYFPFANSKYSPTKKLNFTFDLNSTATGPTAFNEHFGMFVSSKEYHLFEPEKGTPQDYNNSTGTPLDQTNNIKTESKDFSIWKEGTRVVPSFDLRASSKL
jgi:hypothetical protein